MMTVVWTLLLALVSTRAALIEEERLEEYYARNYTWPPKPEDFTPPTKGWIKVMTERFAQIAEMPKSGDRYMGYHQMVHSALLAPNFTEFGFGLARAPDNLVAALRQGIQGGLATATYEKSIPVILGPTPKFISRPDLTQRVLDEMQAYVEEWTGIELTAFQAYGFRLYQNGSQLMMHTDRMQSHIISFILHIDSSDDAEPWPLFIEDFSGNTHEVILTPGDVAFYESSKVAHGRPKPFNGSYYTSVFVHYAPNGWLDTDHQLDAHYRVPPVWRQDPKGEPQWPVMEMAGMSYREPDCPNDWCRASSTIQWGGPGERGYWIKPNRERVPFRPERRMIENEEL